MTDNASYSCSVPFENNEISCGSLPNEDDGSPSETLYEINLRATTAEMEEGNDGIATISGTSGSGSNGRGLSGRIGGRGFLQDEEKYDLESQTSINNGNGRDNGGSGDSRRSARWTLNKEAVNAFIVAKGIKQLVLVLAALILIGVGLSVFVLCDCGVKGAFFF